MSVRVRAVQRTIPGHEAGYSFIEVTVVLALVGVVWAAAVPQIPAMLVSHDFTNTVEQLANDLRLARVRAITQNGKERIRLCSSSYVLQRESPPGSFVDDGAPTAVPPTVTIGSAAGDPTFNSGGLVAVPYTITVTSTHGTTKTVTVSGIGRVTIA